MKNIIKLLSAGIAFSLVAGCSDFEEVNRNPQAVDELAARPYYALNQSILFAQQNPDTGERLFVINWAAAARQDGEDGYGTSSGNYDDSHMSASFNYMCNAMTYCQNAITLCDVQLGNADQAGLTAHQIEFYPNVKAIARIWMVYLMSEFADTFGPMPIDGFQGVNPEFRSVKDVYYYMYDELEDAIASINTSVEPTDEESQCDEAYGYDPVKWKAYGVSMWMRLAMRLSEVEPDKARSEFEAALAAGDGILVNDDTFRVREVDGWDNLSGVMSRTWDWQTLSATMANLTTNLGVDVKAVLSDASGVLYSSADVSRYESRIRDAQTYLGKKFENHFAVNTDNPTKQYFFDALPSVIDPRAFVYFFLPGDYANRKVNGYVQNFLSANARQTEGMYDEDGKLIEGTETDATYCWNGLPAGWLNDQSMGTNGLANGDGVSTYGYGGTYPQLADEYRNSTNFRVFFGPWETYFLLAEAALRGWNVGTTAKAAYEEGIRLSLEYTGMDQHYDSYIASTTYNRVGTSVAFDHTDEPSDYEIEYVDGYTGETKTTTYHYPEVENILYVGFNGKKALNDQLTKIITQKYIANTPWLPLENLSDHRRLGLPFWEIPVSTTTLPYMPEWTSTSYQGPQKPGYFVQRLPYPSSLNNADPTGYAKALELLGGGNSRVTPIWWAIGGHE